MHCASKADGSTDQEPALMGCILLQVLRERRITRTLRAPMAGDSSSGYSMIGKPD